jgi:NAD(P)-dependent dehydrogenase (short-subunit alcohol dehydrogenase family)
LVKAWVRKWFYEDRNGDRWKPGCRIGTAEDIGPVIASLLSDDNHWVNARRIEVTGGTAG